MVADSIDGTCAGESRADRLRVWMGHSPVSGKKVKDAPKDRAVSESISPAISWMQTADKYREW